MAAFYPEASSRPRANAFKPGKPALSHHRTCGSASGGSLNPREPSHRIGRRHRAETKFGLRRQGPPPPPCRLLPLPFARSALCPRLSPDSCSPGPLLPFSQPPGGRARDSPLQGNAPAGRTRKKSADARRFRVGTSGVRPTCDVPQTKTVSDPGVCRGAVAAAGRPQGNADWCRCVSSAPCSRNHHKINDVMLMQTEGWGKMRGLIFLGLFRV